MNIGNSDVDELVVKLVLGTVSLLLFLVGVWYVSRVTVSEVFSEQISRVVLTVILTVISVSSVYGSRLFFKRLESRNSVTKHQAELSYRFVQISVYIGLSVLLISYVWQINLANILIGAGVLGVIVGFAAQNLLSSVFSGIIIFSTDMYRVGDWVEFDNKFGRVQEITFFNTRIKSPQGEQHIIPNETVTSNNITNISQSRYRKDLLIGVDYDDDIEHAITVCDTAVDELARDSESVIVHSGETSVAEFDDSQVTLSVKFWIQHPNPRKINTAQTQVYTTLSTKFEEENITIPFPQRTFSDRQ